MRDRDLRLTSLNVLLDRRLNHALIGLGGSLRLHARASITVAPDVKCVLEGVSLPPEEVVAVPGIASPIIVISRLLK